MYECLRDSQQNLFHFIPKLYLFTVINWKSKEILNIKLADWRKSSSTNSIKWANSVCSYHSLSKVTFTKKKVESIIQDWAFCIFREINVAIKSTFKAFDDDTAWGQNGKTFNVIAPSSLKKKCSWFSMSFTKVHTWIEFWTFIFLSSCWSCSYPTYCC